MFYIYKTNNLDYPYEVLDEKIDGIEPVLEFDPYEYLVIEPLNNSVTREKIELLRLKIEEYDGPLSGLDYYLYGEDE